jgi:hypothetical protein
MSVNFISVTTEFIKTLKAAAGENKKLLPCCASALTKRVFDIAPIHRTTVFNSTYQSLKTTKINQSNPILRK